MWRVFALSAVFGVATLAGGQTLVRSQRAASGKPRMVVTKEIAPGRYLVDVPRSKSLRRGQEESEVRAASEPAEEERGEFEDAKKTYWHTRAWPATKAEYIAGIAGAAEHIKIMPTVVARSGGSPAPRGGGIGALAAPVAPISGSGGQPLIPDGATWEFLGPRNAKTLTVKTGLGPANSYVIGRVNHVAYDPKSPRTIYLASAGGGIWRSQDAGVNWTPVTDFNLDRLETTCVAVNPSTTKTILAGLGDYHGFGVPGGGIARSTNGGQTWSVIGGAVAGLSISAIEFDPDNPSIVIASAGRGSVAGGVFRSSNGGLSWGTVNSASGGDWTSVSIGAKDRSTGSRVYYAARDNDGIYRSMDKGLTWTKLTLPLRYNGAPGTFSTGIEVAASKLDSKTVYVSEGAASAQDGRLFVSRTNGDANTWTDISGQHPLVSDTGTPWTQVWYDHHLTTSLAVVSGTAQDIVYQGLLSVYGNIGGGAFWNNITKSYTNQTQAHTDQQGMGINPLDPNQTIIANDGGIYGMVFNPTTKTWTLDKGVMNQTLGVSQFYGADWHPTNPNIMLGGAQDNSTFVSYGNLSDWRNENSGDGFSAAIFPVNPNYMVSTSQNGTIWLTPNGGTNWAGVGINDGTENFPFDTQIAVDPRNLGSSVQWPFPAAPAPPLVAPAPIVYVGGEHLWRFGYVDTSNTLVQKMGADNLGSITAIAISPSNPSVIYVGTAEGNVWITTNAYTQGQPSLATDVKWLKLNISPVTSLPSAQVNCIVVNPTKPNDITVGIGGVGIDHVWRLVVQFDNNNPPNLISGWTPQAGIQGTNGALPDTAVLSICRDPFDPDSSFYVGTDMGVFGTGDNGSTWANLSKPYGLPNAVVNEIKGNVSTGYLNCATFGRGMWRLKLTDTSGFDMGVSAGITRVAGNLRANVMLTNNAIAGNLTNVRIIDASIRLNGVSNAVTTSTALPVTVSPLLAPGASNSGIVQFSNGSLTAGSFANLSILADGTYGGKTKTVTKTFQVRLP